jgi:hypothetical protein
MSPALASPTFLDIAITYLNIFTMLSATSSLRMFKDKNLEDSMVETAKGAPL